MSHDTFRLRSVVDRDLYFLHPAHQYHEDYGTVLWWHLPIVEPPFVGAGEGMNETQRDGSPTDCRRLQEINWLTHWSFLPDDRKMDFDRDETAKATV